MPKTQLPIANGFYESQSLPISAQRCINWYPNVLQAEGLSQETLFGTPGIRQLVTTGTLNQQNRGMHVKNDILYFVNGTDLYRLDRTIDSEGNDVFGTTSLGVIPGDGPVSMADNGTQLMILIPGIDGYIYDENDVGNEFQLITSAFKGNGIPQIVVFINGYFVCTTDSKKFIASALNDGLTWNALDFGSAEADPDIIRGAFVFKGQLFIFGSETIEVFEGFATSGFPFRRINLFIIPKGLFSPFSTIAATNTFVFVGGGVNESPAVWMFTGNDVQKISTTPIDNLLSKLTETELAAITAVSYAERGAYFVGFKLPDRDMFYDFITGRWHERNTAIGNQLGQSRVSFMATAYGRVVVGDTLDGRIGELDSSLYTEYEQVIFRRIRIMPLYNLGHAIFVSALELVMESGVGDLVVKEPYIRMRYSDDAKTWSNELKRKIGRMGEYFKRTIWRRLGRMPRFRVFEFTMTDAVNPTVIRLDAQLKGSSNG
jgi:hypothetical protein